MINLFSHYVPGRLVILAALEGVVLLIAAQVGISLPLSGSGATLTGAAPSAPALAVVFALGMIVIMLSMGLYQWDVWGNSQSIRVRLLAAFVLGFAMIGLGTVLVLSLIHISEPTRH